MTPAVPPAAELEELRARAAHCTACRLHQTATQTVVGEGPPGARMMLVGEQPGDVEDREGRPFVGPAGRVLDQALAAAGIDRRTVYLTNAVKHFKWVQRGRRRIHQRPTVGEIDACRPWLDAELEVVNPRIVVALGAVAARALLGPGARVTALRGRQLTLEDGRVAHVTAHPSSILRVEDATLRRIEMGRLVDDLSLAARLLRAA